MKIDERKVFLTALLILLYIFGAVYYFNSQKTNQTAGTEPGQQLTEQVSTSQATIAQNSTSGPRLIIPQIYVDAPVVSVGVNKSGFMEVPRNINEVGLYNNGAQPGDNGTAVMDGHLDGNLGERGVFYNLSKLVVGDEIKYINKDGQTFSYRVREIQKLYYSSNSMKVFNSGEGSHLNLVTCSGSWNQTLGTYTERLIVYSDLVK